jgi:hypothetical protein
MRRFCVTGHVFRIVLSGKPPTSNASDSSKPSQHMERLVKKILGPKPAITTFGANDNLYGRIYYFNHETTNVRDIHNIIKPLFDKLGKYVYEDDKQIKHFEGFRLDLEHKDLYFEYELRLSEEPALVNVDRETTCVVEIGELPATAPSLVTVRWL